MTHLSVNINKVALIRNSRGSNLPDLVQVAQDCETFGAQGITVHPRPDQRHVRSDDVAQLKAVVTTEFNIEGYPDRALLDLVMANKPHQCTLVPDAPGQLTSDNGWDTLANKSFLTETIQELQQQGIRVSLFVNPEANMVEGAKAAGADRIEFYTGPFAHDFERDPMAAVRPYTRAAEVANQVEIGINAGHDLNLRNLRFFSGALSGFAGSEHRSCLDLRCALLRAVEYDQNVLAPTRLKGLKKTRVLLVTAPSK